MRALTEIAWDWGIRCFGRPHMENRRIRSLRCTEEVVELGQTLGVPEDVVHKLVSTVYAKAPGDAYQELGGSIVTLMCLFRSFTIDPEQAMLHEIQRCLAKPPEHFAKRNQDKIDMGLDA